MLMRTLLVKDQSQPRLEEKTSEKKDDSRAGRGARRTLTQKPFSSARHPGAACHTAIPPALGTLFGVEQVSTNRPQGCVKSAFERNVLQADDDAADVGVEGGFSKTLSSGGVCRISPRTPWEWRTDL